MLQFIFEPRITSSRRQVVKDKIETITKKKKKNGSIRNEPMGQERKKTKQRRGIGPNGPTCPPWPG